MQSLKRGRQFHPSKAQLLIVGLSLMLICQLAAAIVLKLHEPEFVSSEPHGKLLSCDQSQIKGITIAERDPYSQQVTSLSLSKASGVWSVAGDVPAKEVAVSKLIQALLDIKLMTPVITAMQPPERLRVGDNNFEQCITVETGISAAAPVKIYLGAAASPVERYLRVAGDKANSVYCCPIETSLLSGKNRDWIDGNFATVDSTKIREFSVNDFAVSQIGGNQWMLKSNGKTCILPRSVTQELLTVLAVPVSAILENASQPSGRPDLELTERLTDGSTIVYSFTSVKGAKYFRLSISNSPHCFEVPAKYVDAAKKLTAAVVLHNVEGAKTENVKRS